MKPVSRSLILCAALAAGLGSGTACAEAGWTTLLSTTAKFPGGATASAPLVRPFHVPAQHGTLRVTVTESPYPPYSRGFGYGGVGTVVQWGSGPQAPRNFTGDFTDVCGLAGRPGGSRTPSTPVEGRDMKQVSFRHNDSGKACRDLWAAVFPAGRSVNGKVVEQFPATIVLAIEFKPDDGSTAVPASPAPGAAAPQGAPVNESAWSVGGHPVHWVFHANGTVEAPGLWKGTWKSAGDGVEVTLSHQGASDTFLVKFARDGESFTAYKGGAVYRNGVRTR